MWLTAGVFGEGVQGISVNGNNNNQNNYQLDGSGIYNFNNATANDSLGFFGSISIHSPDAIQEFKLWIHAGIYPLLQSDLWI
jgi:hypothetical protein